MSISAVKIDAYPTWNSSNSNFVATKSESDPTTINRASRSKPSLDYYVAPVAPAPSIPNRVLTVLESIIDMNGNGFSGGDFILMGLESSYSLPFSATTLLTKWTGQGLEKFGGYFCENCREMKSLGIKQFLQVSSSYSFTLALGKTVLGNAGMYVGEGLGNLGWGLQKISAFSGHILGKVADVGDDLWSGARSVGTWLASFF